MSVTVSQKVNLVFIEIHTYVFSGKIKTYLVPFWTYSDSQYIVLTNQVKTALF